MKTLAQAKRDFIVGKTFKITMNEVKPFRVGAVGTITKVFTNKFEYLDSITNKTFTFWWGSTKENKYVDNELRVYHKHNNEMWLIMELQ